MSYNLTFTDQTLDVVSKAPIVVTPGTVNSTRTPLSFTGTGAANYGGIQQDNLLHLLENFASATEPSNPTIGQTWYDASTLTLKVLISSSPITWKSLGGIQITDAGDAAPVPASLGDIWFERQGSASGVLYVYTGLGRYPTTATTIGGWEQIYPTVEVAGGRDEYDSIREMVEKIAGDSVGSYGSGAIGRLITNLTDFGSLDLDLRQKYDAIVTASGADSNVLTSTAADVEISRQSPSSTLFLFADTNTQNDSYIGGLTLGQPDLAASGTILLRGVVTTLPNAVLDTDFQIDDAYILYDSTSTLASRPYSMVVKNDDGTWQYDNGGGVNTWTTFTPTATQYIIGTISTFVADAAANNIFPGTKQAIMWSHAVPIIGVKTTSLKVEPNSQDWDALLATAKYAINRLEVPTGYVKAISPVPFVIDGRQAPASLTSLTVTDVRYPSIQRRARRRVGMVSQVMNFTETLNALSSALSNRFSLKGINGASGTNALFDSTIVPTVQTTQSAVIASGTGNLRVKFRFNSFAEKARFLSSGGVIQVGIAHTGGTTTGDTNLRSALNTTGNFRITADKTRILGSSLPLTITKATSAVGIWNSTAVGKQLTQQITGPVTITVNAYRTTNVDFDIEVVIAAGSALAGTTAVTFTVMASNETDGTNLIYPAPLPYNASTDLVDPF